MPESFGMCARPVIARRPGLGCPEVERLGVDDDLAAARGEDADEGADRRQVERPIRPARDHVDLVLRDAVDIADRPELGPIDTGDRDADHLVPVDLAAGQLGVRSDVHLEICLAQGVGTLAGRDLVESRITSPVISRAPELAGAAFDPAQ